jgi:catechol 2,3-dioxygenase-like lactoylglutathione lyase family enzyme
MIAGATSGHRSPGVGGRRDVARLHHIHIKAEEPQRSAAWWAETLGASVLPSYEIDRVQFVPVELGGVRIILSRPGPGDAAATGPVPTIPHFGLEHLGIVVADLDGIVARCEEQGLTIHQRRTGTDFEVAFVASPDGVVLELLQPRA